MVFLHVFLVLSKKKIRIFISCTLYGVKVISVVDPETFLVTPWWASLKLEFKLEWAREQDTTDVACGP